MGEQARMAHHSERDGFRLTIEHALWVTIGGIALAMRLAQLGEAPLTAAEASSALQAWRAASGQGLPLAGYEPLVLVLNSFLCFVAGTSDALARLVPAVAGAMLSLTPLLVRRRLGRMGALATGLYLAVSPTALIASRQLSGTTLAGVGAMAFVGGMVRFVDSGRRRWLHFSAVALAVGLTAGSAGYGVLVPVGFAYGAACLLGGVQGRFTPRSLSALVSHWGPRFVVTFAIAAVVMATGVGWNAAGMSAAGDTFTEWWARFRPASSAAVSPVLLLTVYDLPAVLVGMVGGLVALGRGRSTAAVLVAWAASALLLLQFMPGRVPTDTLWVVLPLAMLGGLAVEALFSRGWVLGAAGCGYLAVVLVLWAHAYLGLARYAARGDWRALGLVPVVVIVQVLVAVMAEMIAEWTGGWRTGAAGTMVALLSLTLASGWGVAYGRPTDPREPLLARPTAVNVRDLVDTLEELSWRETGMPTTLALVYEAPEDSVVAWYLRSFEKARRTGWLDDLAPEDLGATVVTLGREAALRDGGEVEYLGQDFALQRQWTPVALTWRFWKAEYQTTIEWFLFRTGVEWPEPDAWATLWRAEDVSHGQW